MGIGTRVVWFKVGYSSAGVKLVLGRGKSRYIPYILNFYYR